MKDKLSTSAANLPERIETMTAEVVKKSFLQVVEDMRSAAKQAKDEALKLEMEAEELSQQMLQAGELYAERVSALIENCRQASESFRQHRSSLAKLPEAQPREIGDRADNEGVAALQNLTESIKVPKALKRSDALVQRDPAG